MTVYDAEPDLISTDCKITGFPARHGVQANVMRRPSDAESHVDIGDLLLSMAADVDADLLVMGRDGHTRFKEILLGGATRTILQSMSVPVLMAHRCWRDDDRNGRPGSP
jgi:hypothetical protein